MRRRRHARSTRDQVQRCEQPEAVAVDALLTRPDGRWKIAGHVVAASFHLEPFMEKPPFSLRNVALDVLADPDGIRAAGNIGLPEFDPRDLTIDVRGRYASRVLHLADASIAINETPSKLRASGSIAFDGEAPTLDLAARWEALQWPLNEQAVVSSATGDVTLRGPLPYEFAVNAQVDGPNIPTASGSAIGSLSKDQVVVSQYNFAALEGLLTGDAHPAIRRTARMEAHHSRHQHESGRAVSAVLRQSQRSPRQRTEQD